MELNRACAARASFCLFFAASVASAGATSDDGALKPEIGVNNLTDRDYVIEDGYHAPGRTYFANVRVKF